MRIGVCLQDNEALRVASESNLGIRTQGNLLERDELRFREVRTVSRDEPIKCRLRRCLVCRDGLVRLVRVVARTCEAERTKRLIDETGDTKAHIVAPTGQVVVKAIEGSAHVWQVVRERSRKVLRKDDVVLAGSALNFDAIGNFGRR